MKSQVENVIMSHQRPLQETLMEFHEAYSRSIGVDIRYVLYIMKYFGEADEVLSEMGVEL
jgi:hypothetical protein